MKLKLFSAAAAGCLLACSQLVLADGQPPTPTIEQLWEIIQSQQAEIEALKKEQQETAKQVLNCLEGFVQLRLLILMLVAAGSRGLLVCRKRMLCYQIKYRRIWQRPLRIVILRRFFPSAAYAECKLSISAIVRQFIL